MNGLAELMKIAGGDEGFDYAGIFGGYCTGCGRGMYKQKHSAPGLAMGWIQKATASACMTCYYRDWRKQKRAAGIAV